MFLRNGKLFDITKSHIIDGVEYGPPGYFLIKEHRDALNVVEEPDPDIPDPAYFSYMQGDDGKLIIADLPLADVKRSKSIELDIACQNAIFEGFTSSALGTVFTYPAKTRDQINLSASVLASMLPNVDANWVTQFWCKDSNDVWAFRNHTATQIQQVGIDGKAAIMFNLNKNEGLQQQVEAAATVADVKAIIWQ